MNTECFLLLQLVVHIVFFPNTDPNRSLYVCVQNKTYFNTFSTSFIVFRIIVNIAKIIVSVQDFRNNCNIKATWVTGELPTLNNLYIIWFLDCRTASKGNIR